MGATAPPLSRSAACAANDMNSAAREPAIPARRPPISIPRLNAREWSSSLQLAVENRQNPNQQGTPADDSAQATGSGQPKGGFLHEIRRDYVVYLQRCVRIASIPKTLTSN